jgi:hypothetical protein
MNKVSQQSKTTVVVTLFALAFTLSGLPGLKGQALQDGSSDLSSMMRSCDIDGQIKKDGDADCNASVSGNNKVKGNVHVEYVAKTETTEAQYHITGEFSVPCSVCEGGVRTTPLETQVSNLSLVQSYLDEQADELVTGTKKDEDTENCKIDQDGEENNKAERLQCLIEKMDGMEEKEARRFYDKKIKGELAELAQSSNPQDAALAASLAGKLHQQLGVNCAQQVAAAQQSALAAQANPAQAFNPLMSTGQSTYTQSTPTDYIKESSCDIMMMANYNGRLTSLGMQLTGPNKFAAAQQIQSMQQGWANYFTGRGFNLQNPMMNQINMDAGTLLTQMNDFNKQFAENYADITKRHADLLQSGNIANNNGQVNGANNNGTRDLRLLRGGAPLPENSNGQGTPAVTPFPAMNGANNGAMNLGNPPPTGPSINGIPNNAPKVLAPMRDAPVGS